MKLSTPTWVDRLMCRFFRNHDWFFVTGPGLDCHWLCFWCGKRRDAVEVEQ